MQDRQADLPARDSEAPITLNDRDFLKYIESVVGSLARLAKSRGDDMLAYLLDMAVLQANNKLRDRR